MADTANIPLAAIDIETSGLAITNARVVQIGIVQADPDGTVRATWSAMIDHPFFEPTELPNPTTSPDVRATSFAEIANEVRTQLMQRVLVAHNAAFDIHILVREFADAGSRWRPDDVICTLTLARLRLPEEHSYRLAHLAQRLDLPRPTHDALVDARAALALYVALSDDASAPPASA